MKRIIVTNEIASSLLNSEISEYEKSLLRSNPKNFLFTLLKMDFDDSVEVRVVENDKELVHLSLPFYGEVNFLARRVTTQELRQSVGGTCANQTYENPMSECGAQAFLTANRQFSDDDMAEIGK